ncbi:RNA polymerase sigma factor [Aestuariibacter halophilus]|uniref:RNA polymerase sigma factor n=1 Tax=Fluctibacter halophilus TaxID=226011 RepID=A0ABS8G8A0_9ALTE|nr:RNA polymerase sigma factor [Aestuariibacter halophilus]MCC2616760.1 RNA polymerase sigma factor [Aestuariibacter halophilus]
MSQGTDIEQLLTEHAPMLARIAANHEVNLAVREELLQEISVAVWHGLARFRGEASVKTYIARIAHNRCVDHVVREQRHYHPLDTDAPVEQAPETFVSESEHVRMDLHAAMLRLSLGFRQVIGMQLEGFTQSEIAQVLGISEAAVAQRSSRARKQLEQWL